MNTKEIINTLKEEIKNKTIALNEESAKAWQDDKYLEATISRKSTDTEIHLDIAVGKWETTYHSIVLSIDGYQIARESEHNPLLDTLVGFYQPYCLDYLAKV